MATTILGTRNADRLTARASGDTVEGLAGNDTLSSSTQTGVYLFGGDGNDTLIAKTTDTLVDGGAGTDTVQFAAAVGANADTWLEGIENVVITNTSAGSYDFTNQTEALNITGSRLADTITGGSGNDTITGGLGIDSLTGGAGDDVLVAEATDGKIDGGTGTNTVRFATAVTTAALLDADLVNIQNVEITNTASAAYDFSVQTDVLNITGGRGNDTITGGTLADTLSGGNGNDVLIASASDALVDGGSGNDTVRYAAGVGDGVLTDAGLANVEYVVITNTGAGSYDFSSQSEGLDITGTGLADTIKGGSGADVLRGGLGNDSLYAGENDRLIDGGNGSDTAYFAASVSARNLLDSELINVETVAITGTGAYDFSAQSEKLAITATGGAVTITGGRGVDTLTGGSGDDVIVASDLDVINGTSGNDTVRFAAAVSAANLVDADLENVDNIVITNTNAASYDFSAQAGEAFSVTGGSGNDTLIMATSTVDTISAGAGNDVIVAEDTDYLIDGGLGVDTVQFAAAVTGGDLLDEDLANVEYVVVTNTNAGGGIYDFSVQTESLQITGTQYADNIDGGYRADTITGGDGADTLDGNEGADLIIADTSDSINGGEGDDTVRFAAAVTSATLSDADLTTVENIVITNTGNAAYDFSNQGVAGVENLNITGGSGSDTITGGQDADTLSGGAGNDVLVAQGTDALIDGGAGTDTVRFGASVAASDLADADLVNVERVEITASGSYDFSAQTEALTITGYNAAETINGGSAADSITGGNSADKLYGNSGADTLVGGASGDTLVGGAGIDYLYGGDDDDVLVAEDTDGRIDGGANNLSGGLDVAQFASAVSAVNLTDAKLVGIEKIEITNTTTDASYDFSAQSEALIIVGNSRADTLTGTRDWDSIDGGSGNDLLSGGLGSDTLRGSAGDDTLTGGAGYDVFQVDSGSDTITDLSAGETLTVSSSATALVSGALLDLTLLASASSNSGTVNITGSTGNDLIKGTSGVDVITGGVGTDSLYGSGGNDSFVIAAGDSVFSNGTTAQSNSAALDKIMDFSGDLIVISGAITDTSFSVAGNVFVGLGSGGADDNQDNVNDFLTTTYLVDLDGTATTFELGLDVTTNGSSAAFANSAAAQAATVLNVTGTTGDDAITGGANADTISGGEGADVITGGAGADLLTGGAGADNFVFNGTPSSDTGLLIATADLIADFVSGTDTISGMGVAGSAGSEYSEAAAVVDFATALAAANVVFAVTNAQSYYLTSITGGVGLLFINDDNNSTADAVIQLTGITSANFAATDILA